MHQQKTGDRLWYLWLAIAIVVMPFAVGKWTVAIAAWLAPVFWLRFVRGQRPSRGILVMMLACGLVMMLDWPGNAEVLGGPFYYVLAFGTGVVYALPFLVDRLVAPRLRGVASTLVFPCALTAISYLNSFGSPFGTWGNIAYTQYGDLPFLQLVSLTGLWGIDFLMGWTAAVINFAWERGFAWRRIRAGAIAYAGLLVLVWVFGAVRVASFAADANTVRIAGVTASPALIDAVNKQLEVNFEALFSDSATDSNRQQARLAVAQASSRVFDQLFSLTRQEAGGGAKIVVWPECSGGGVPLMQEDEAALRATARSLSSTYGIYLDMGLCVVPAQPTHLRPLFDESVLLDPVGGELWTYQKAHPIPGAEPFPPGDGQVPLVDTAYGRLASVICFDADFAGTVRQAGEAQTDLLLVPSNDWLAIDPYHTQMASFRAIENGFSEIRTTAHGLSAVVDYAGRVLATSDFYTTDPQVVVADAPAHGVRTAYATIGDWFAWFSLAALALLCAVAILSRARYGYWKSGPQVEPR